MPDKAPIALFVYKRLDTTRQTVEALALNAEAQDSILYVFSDAARTGDDRDKVQAVRDYVHGIKGFKEVRVVENPVNKGLGASIIDGTSRVVSGHGRVIVLEDDIIVSRYFLEYLNAALDLYENDQRVISVSAYMFPVSRPLPECFFLRWADNLGWGTWKRGWDLFEPDGAKLLKELDESKEARAFDFDGAFNYREMLQDQVKGKINSWAIRWCASAFLNNKMTLYPGTPLVKHIGYGEDASNTLRTDPQEIGVLDPKEVRIRAKAMPVIQDEVARQIIREYFLRIPKNAFERVIFKCRSLFKIKKGLVQ